MKKSKSQILLDGKRLCFLPVCNLMTFKQLKKTKEMMLENRKN